MFMVDFDSHFGSRLVSCSTRDTVVSSSFKSPASLSCSSPRSPILSGCFWQGKGVDSAHEWVTINDEWYVTYYHLHVSSNRLQVWSHVWNFKGRTKINVMITDDWYYFTFCSPSCSYHFENKHVWKHGLLQNRCNLLEKHRSTPAVSRGFSLGVVRWSIWSPS